MNEGGCVMLVRLAAVGFLKWQENGGMDVVSMQGQASLLLCLDWELEMAKDEFLRERVLYAVWLEGFMW